MGVFLFSRDFPEPGCTGARPHRSPLPSLRRAPGPNLLLNGPFRQVRGFQPLTVAAFAVCIQSVIRPAVSELPLSVCHPVCAWLIATRKKNTPAVIRRSARISQLSTCPSSIPRTAEATDQNRFIFRRIAIIKKAMTSPVVNFVRNPSIERPLFFPQ